MNYVTGTTKFHIRGPSAVSLGKFDGLHRGHQKLIGRVLSKRQQGLTSVIFTFEKNPTRMLSGLSGQNIMTNELTALQLGYSLCGNLLLALILTLAVTKAFNSEKIMFNA